LEDTVIFFTAPTRFLVFAATFVALEVLTARLTFELLAVGLAFMREFVPVVFFAVARFVLTAVAFFVV